jgi:glycosyl transferase family 25
MKLGIIVINLDHSTDRLAKISERLQALGLTFDRLSGTYVKDIPQTTFRDAYDPELNRRSFYKVLSPGELACYISHQRAWQHLVDRGWDAALVFEDDAIPTPEMLRALDVVLALPQPWDIVKLGSYTRKPVISRTPVAGGFIVCEYAKIPVCAHAQVITREGAQKLLRSRQRVARPVDVDLQHPWEHGCRILGLTPFSVRADNVPSDTWVADNQRASFRSNRLNFYRTKLRFAYESMRYNIAHYGWRRALGAEIFRTFDQS